jgi:hypothetical protein
MVQRYGHLAPVQLSKAAELVAQKGQMASRSKVGKLRNLLILLVVREGLEPSTSAL